MEFFVGSLPKQADHTCGPPDSDKFQATSVVCEMREAAGLESLGAAAGLQSWTINPDKNTHAIVSSIWGRRTKMLTTKRSLKMWILILTNWYLHHVVLTIN
jgi:hypothetical protein